MGTETGGLTLDDEATVGETTAVGESEPTMPDSGPPERVERYVVLDRIGSGGMGVVYAAYDPDLDRKVALKLLSPGVGGEQARARLIHEARAMARLTHPNIATIFDVGVVGERVFIAMQLAEGGTLREWMAERSRVWREALAVCTAAGRGLIAAHEAGIVHRDFKPENVLLERDGGVRVVDFGIARTDDDDEASEAAPTDDLRTQPSDIRLAKTRGVVGTPAYMAPEQHFGADTDARSDQFSFCVVLFEALYGRRPFKGRTTAEIALSVAEGEVVQPTDRRGVPRATHAALMKGLSVHPDDRWPSMKELLAAVEPKPFPVRPSLAVLGLAVAGLAAAWGLAPSGEEEAEICAGGVAKFAAVWNSEARTEVVDAFAATQLSYAGETSELVAERFDVFGEQWTTAHRDACEATQVRKEQSEAAMDIRMACLQRQLWDAEAMVEVFHSADAQTVERATGAVGDLPRVLDCVDIERLQRRGGPPQDEALRERVDALSKRLSQARAVKAAGRYNDAAELGDALLGEAKEIEHPPLSAEVMRWRGKLYASNGNNEQAEKLLMETVWFADEHRLEEVEFNAKVDLVGVVGHGLARPEDGELWGKHANAALKRLEGEGTDMEARLLHQLATSAVAAGNYAVARDFGERELEIRRTLRDGNPIHLAGAVNILGVAAYSLADWPEAARHFESALEIRKSAHGPDHPTLATAMSNLGGTYERMDEDDKALPLYERAIALTESANGPEHITLSFPLTNLGISLVKLERYDEAIAAHERALKLRRAKQGEDHPDVAYSLKFLGEAYRAKGEPERALEVQTQARDILVAKLGEEHPEIAFLEAALGATLEELGRNREAMARLELARSLYEKHEIVDSEVGRLQWSIARVLWALGRNEEAIAQARTAEATSQASGSAKDLERVRAWLATHGEN